MTDQKKKTAVKKTAKAIAKNAMAITAKQDRRAFTIETSFALGGSKPLCLVNEAGATYWLLKLNIKEILNRSYHQYKIRMSVDEKPFEQRILDTEQKIDEIGSESHLPGMGNNGEIKALQSKIKEIKASLAKLIADTEIIEFYASVTTISYKGIMTVVELQIPADNIQALNKNRFFFNQFKIELEPITENIVPDEE